MLENRKYLFFIMCVCVYVWEGHTHAIAYGWRQDGNLQELVPFLNHVGIELRALGSAAKHHYLLSHL